MSDTTPSYKPQADSVAGRVLAYFRRLPDEELSAKDIGLKFSADPNSVQALLKPAVIANMLTRDGTIYSAGPQIGESAGQAPHNVFAGAVAGTKARKGPAGPQHHIDINALKVDDSVPYVNGSRTAGNSKWSPLFDKLTKPGQSIAIPAPVKAAVAAAANKRNKEKRGTFRVGNSGPTEARIWRIA